MISKEPDKYESAYPFRGVVELGSQKFGFVLDAKPGSSTAAEEKDRPNTPAVPAPQRYQRLFLDANHNADLTDDPVIEAPERGGSSPIVSNFRYASYQFPQIDLTIDAEGTPMNYSFTLQVSSMSQPDYQYAYVSLSSAAYRHGEITLDGKTKRVLLVDYNSNGRFNDQPSGSDVQYADGSLYLTPGDMLYLDLKSEQQAAGFARYGYDLTSNDEQYPVSKYLFVDGRLYDLKISAAGDALTLEPSAVPVGFVTNPNSGFRAVVFGEGGVMKITGGDAQQSPLPAGQWRLASYTISQTVTPAKPETAGDEKPSLMERITGALTGRAAGPVSNYSLVSARGKAEASTLRGPRGRDDRPAERPSVQARGHGDACGQCGDGLPGNAARRRCRRNLQQLDRQRQTAAGSEVQDQQARRHRSRQRHVRVWLRLHLPVLVASTQGASRPVPREGRDGSRSVQD